jgi:hypothetical protein
MPEVCDSFQNFTTEQSLTYYRHRGERILDFLRCVAKERRCIIAYSAIRGVRNDAKHPFRNSTQVIGRDGEVIGVYDKNHIVNTMEYGYGIAYGTEAKIIKSDIGKLACAICFDLNFNTLYERYKPQKPNLIIFSSMYHGGLKQQQWAYELGAYFAGAIGGQQCRILNPFGETVAASTNYYDYTTGRVNLDYVMAHMDFNHEIFPKLKQKYGSGVTIHDPGYVGAVLISSERDDMTAADMAKEFGVELLGDYWKRSLKHRKDHIVK